MAKIFNFKLNLILLAAIFVPAMLAIYVPEHVNNQRLIMDTLEMKPEEYSYHKQHTIDDDNKLLQPEYQQWHGQHLQRHGNKLNDGQQSVTNAKYISQRHHTSYDINDDVVNVNSNEMNDMNTNNFENLEAQPTSFKEQQQQLLDDDKMSVINDEDDDDDSHSRLLSRQRRQLSDFLIAPNTRWCGRGNTANGTYNHLGGATMADKCCRTHDHCKVYIPAMSNRFDLFNYRPYTLSHCNCDRRFRTCLKMASDEDANTIGKLFFNLVQTQCFVLVKESVCMERAPDGTCSKKQSKQKAYLRNNKKF